jgi:hypothetical protein
MEHAAGHARYCPAKKTDDGACLHARKRTVAWSRWALKTRVLSQHALLLYWNYLARTEADRLK